jgi:uncharacterized protein (DUF2141 family)
MKTVLLAAAAMLAAAGPATAGEATLKLRFQGLETPKGALMVALFDEAGYAKGRTPVGAATAPVGGVAVETTLSGLAPGRYGLRVFHDVNGDGKMNTNPLGIPTEPVAFSNDAPMRFGPAKWADAAFEVRPGDNLHVVTIR